MSGTDFPLLTTLIQALREREGGRGLNKLAAENLASVLAAIEAAGFTIIEGPLPIEQADKRREILAYFGTGHQRTLFLARWKDDRRSQKPRPYWTADSHMGVIWERSNQPTHFWYPPE